jgi:hypothetical protein
MVNMNQTLSDWLGLGLEPRHFSTGQVCLRGLVVFVVTLLIVRIAHKRFLARISAFDAVLGFVLASSMARAINGSAAFFPSLVVGFFGGIADCLEPAGLYGPVHPFGPVIPVA